MSRCSAARREPARAARSRALRWLALALVCLVPSAAATAQGTEPDEAGSTAPRFAVSAEVSATVGPEDHEYFNYTDYYQNALRLVVAAVGVSFRATRWAEAVAEGRLETDRVRLSALYARLRPSERVPLTIAAGRVPPVFGAFAAMRYGSENPLISRPLAYQYLTSLRYDVVPVSADALLAVRGDGWRVRYPIPGGAPPASPYGTPYAPGMTRTSAAPGVPPVSTSRWDTGAVVHYEQEHVELAGGITVGSLSDPRVDDNNGGRQLAARAVWRPSPAWSIGTSLARGAFLADTAAEAAAPAADELWPQQALGLDAAFARGYLDVRGEVIVSSWSLPAVAPPIIDAPLRSFASTLQARYRLSPRVDAAARADWLGFSKITGTLYGGVPTPWDAEVARVEVGAAVKVARQARLKLVWQHDWRFGASRVSRGYPAAQFLVWY